MISTLILSLKGNNLKNFHKPVHKLHYLTPLDIRYNEMINKSNQTFLER